MKETNEERALADDLTLYIRDKHTSDECIGFIDGYKKALEKVENLGLFTVSQQRELLLSFLEWGTKQKYDIWLRNEKAVIDTFLKDNNCG